MRFSTVATVLLGAASASATTMFARQSYPSCALPCMQSANTGSCSLTDYHCLCTNESFVSNTTQCIYSSCQGTDLQTALQTGQQLCASVGVTLSSVPVSTPASSATRSSATSSSTSPASTPTSTTSSASKTSRNAILGLAAAALAAFCL